MFVLLFYLFLVIRLDPQFASNIRQLGVIPHIGNGPQINLFYKEYVCDT